MTYENYSIAVLIPCFNEEHTVAQVVSAFREQLPHAHIYVYDNNSTDRTVETALKAGAIVRRETRQGKGYVIRRAFADVASDIYVMVDGDSTYPAEHVRAMIETLIAQKLDMVTASRAAEAGAYRAHHDMGNRLFNKVVAALFGAGLNDIFSGYRVFSQRFVKSFPAISRGFEIETELSVHALDLSLPFTEMPVPYKARPEGSVSKLHTYRDGLRILGAIVTLFKETKPFQLFSLIAVLLVALACVLSYPLVVTFLETGLVPRFPTAIIIVGLLIFAMVSFTSGIILEGIAHLRRENKRLHYLRLEMMS